jgi:hypothetical protein
MKNHLQKLVVFFVLFFLTSCQCRYKTLVCAATNSTVLYPASQKCLKEFYQDAVKTYSPTLKATVDVIEQVKISADVGVDNKAQLLKDKLSSEDQLMQGILQSATLTLQQRPCDGDAVYKQALEYVSQYKIKLETIKADIQKSAKSDVSKVLDKYTQGKDDGRNVGIIIGSLDRYFADNNKYPGDLDELKGNNAIEALKAIRLSIIYTRESENTFTLRFAGEDGKINTEDDKLHKGINGKPVVE